VLLLLVFFSIFGIWVKNIVCQLSVLFFLFNFLLHYLLLGACLCSFFTC
jgi:hypothetical protein